MSPRAMASLFALLTTMASSSFAQTSEERALDLKHDGDAALVERRYVDALSAYDESYGLVANPAIHYNRGRALQFLARYPEALAAYERFATEAPPALRAKVEGLQDILEELRGKVATLVLQIDGAPKRVLIGGRDVKLELLKDPLRVNAGSTTIEILSDANFDYRRDVVLIPRVTTNIDAKLTPRHTFGHLRVVSNVDHASVFVDGDLVGFAPVETAIRPGSHPIRVAHDGYVPATTSMSIQVGQHYDVFLNPTRRAPITASPLFWTGIGVAVVGAVIGIVFAATQEGNLPSGNFSPGQLRR